jgi:hypothetical protein
MSLMMGAGYDEAWVVDYQSRMTVDGALLDSQYEQCAIHQSLSSKQMTQS